jgi:hypothetical protein
MASDLDGGALLELARLVKATEEQRWIRLHRAGRFVRLGFAKRGRGSRAVYRATLEARKLLENLPTWKGIALAASTVPIRRKAWRTWLEREAGWHLNSAWYNLGLEATPEALALSLADPRLVVEDAAIRQLQWLAHRADRAFGKGGLWLLRQRIAWQERGDPQLVLSETRAMLKSDAWRELRRQVESVYLGF